MSRHTPDAEQYDEALTALTRRKFAAIKAALVARAPQTTKLLFDALAEYVADDQALTDLMVKTAAGKNELAAVLDHLIHIEAEEWAKAEAARIERARPAADAEARVERATWDRQFA